MRAPLPPERWQRVNDLFHEALERDAPERLAWLSAACAGDDDLRREVESLLSADDPGDGGDIGGAVDHAVAQAAIPTIGAGYRIGPYQILNEIGHGGMATVFLASRADADFEQRVAIKVVRGALGADSARRFRAERQILATLEHPCIARLIDGGETGDGVPYFVMDYVEGLPIDVYCDQHTLPLRQRLELFCRVCNAVSHAHQSFIVHRDIKPTNILVTTDGTPKLLDFGIAKLMDERLPDDTPMTVTGFRAMTPEYASPEQVRGYGITTASDVYSLGVLLYQLLTGERPLDFKSRHPSEILQIVSTTEPRKPSTVVASGRHARQLAGDLDTILLTALAKDPSRRYSTASAFADDIRRHLNGLPVVARPATAWYRATRFAARHRAGVAVVGLFLIMAAAFAVAVTRQTRAVRFERDAARQVTNLLLEMYATLDPSGSAGGQLTAEEVLARGVARVRGEFQGQPDTQVTLLSAMGALHSAIGQPERAAGLLREAVAIHRSIGPDTAATAATLTSFAEATFNAGRAPDAEAPARDAIEISSRTLGPRHPETARAMNILGLVMIFRGRTIEGATTINQAVNIWAETKGTESREYADGVRNLLRAWRERGDYPQAEQFAPAELERLERNERARLAARRRAFGDIHLLTAEAQSSLGRLLYVMGRPAEAEPLFREAMAARARIMGAKHLSVGEAVHNLAQALQSQRRFAEAEAMYKTSIEFLDLSLPRHPQRPVNVSNLATLMVDMQRFGEAERLFRSAIETRQGMSGVERAALARTMRLLARLLLRAGRLAEAEAVADEALFITRTALGDAHPESQIATRLHTEIQAALSH